MPKVIFNVQFGEFVLFHVNRPNRKQLNDSHVQRQYNIN